MDAVTNSVQITILSHLTLHYTITTFNDPEEEGFRKH